MATKSKEKISIVGSGLIGRSWAMIFASAGYNVVIYDVKQTQITEGLEFIKEQLKDLQSKGLLKGSLSPDEQMILIKGSTSLEETVRGAKYIQECVPEVLEVKNKVFLEMEQFADDQTILASSCSGIQPSKFTEDVKRRHQCVVCHPINPPYHAPLVEVVPSPWTDPGVIRRTRALLEEVGQVPVTVNKEIRGFALNRVQYALVAECWRLINDGVITVEDMDRVMWAGLGPRYAFIGPFEVMHLNAEGLGSYLERYGQLMQDTVDSAGPPPTFSGPEATKIVEELNHLIPLDKLEERRKRRDERMSAVAKLKREMDAEDAEKQ
ncbi:lambda-crystallin-like [Amphiura filiformis]|uniref:lambda-crystallin-like n=2 Tax=Amphiura filiformis TaxID=82378 RepID=UPI003B2182F6